MSRHAIPPHLGRCPRGSGRGTRSVYHQNRHLCSASMHWHACFAKLPFPAFLIHPQRDDQVDSLRSSTYPLLNPGRYATSVPSPTTTRTFAPAYSKAAKLLKTSLSTSTWGSWLPGQTKISATDTADPYGQAAWSSMWLQADLQNYVRQISN